MLLKHIKRGTIAVFAPRKKGMGSAGPALRIYLVPIL
jgi:hypothetical protein